jgi:MGT family glycosyltransferase
MGRKRYLFVLWQSGGGTQPMLGAVRLLGERGHGVDVLGPSALRERVGASGARWLAAPPEAEFDPSRGRALEDQPDFTYELTCGVVLARAALDASAVRTYDVLVADHFLYSTLAAARSSGPPTVSFAHTAYRFHGAIEPDWEIAARAQLAKTCRALGLELPGASSESLVVQMSTSADLALVAMTDEFDPWPLRPTNVVHVGPLFEEAESELAWDDPWLHERPGPIVVVSLSTQYMHQERTLRRILAALGTMPVRVIVTTGYELERDDFEPSPDTLVRGYVPHRALLPHADLVVTHGGMGTIMAAFACGIPLVCVPLGRDQPGNARRVVELGAGIAVPEDATSELIASAVKGAFGSAAVREAAARMRRDVESYGGGAVAVAALEAVQRSRAAKV